MSIIELPEKIVLGCVMWGRNYINLFNEIVIYNHINMLKNLTAAELSRIYKYIIATDYEGEAYIRQSSNFLALANILNVEIIVCSDEKYVQEERYNRFTKLLNMILEKVIELNAYYVCLAPDTLMNSQALARIIELTDCGYKLVSVFSLRVSMQNFCCVWKRRAMCGGEQQNIGSREMVEMSMGNLHAGFASLCIRNETFNIDGLHGIAKNINDAGYVISSNYYHSIMFKPKILIDELDTHDANYLQTNDYDFTKDVYIIKDSDEMFHTSLTDDNDNISVWKYTSGDFNNDFDVLEFAIKQCDVGYDYQLKYILTAVCRIHVKEIDDAWLNIETQFLKWHKNFLNKINLLLNDNLYANPKSNQVLQKAKSIALFGYGSCGQRIFKHLIEHNINVVKILDNNIDGAKVDIKGNDVFKFEFKQLTSIETVVIASDWHRDILKQIRELGYLGEIVIAFYYPGLGAFYLIS